MNPSSRCKSVTVLHSTLGVEISNAFQNRSWCTMIHENVARFWKNLIMRVHSHVVINEQTESRKNKKGLIFRLSTLPTTYWKSRVNAKLLHVILHECRLIFGKALEKFPSVFGLSRAPYTHEYPSWQRRGILLLLLIGGRQIMPTCGLRFLPLSGSRCKNPPPMLHD